MQQRRETHRQVFGAAAAAADSLRADRVDPHPHGGEAGGRGERGDVFEASQAHLVR